MQLRVWGESEPDNVVRLRLISEDNDIVLVAVNEDGKRKPRSALLVIEHDGTIRRSFGVNEQLGFDLDHLGRIKLADE